MKQVIPADITGLVGAPAESVVDHKFGSSDPFTLGVEEEYMLLDPESFDLVQHIETVLDAVEGDELADRINAELMQSVLEIATPVCRTAGDVMRELQTLRGYVTEVAGNEGLRVGSAGTHPFSLFERQRITAKDRYHALIDQLQYVARRELIFGMHIHVAVDDPDKAIQVVNGLLPHLGPLLALSASSPFWRGEPTGLASSRQIVFSAFPRSGPPPRFRDYDDYAAVVGQLERTGCIADYTHIWWDIRPHPKWGTIEVRICDAVTRVEDAVAIARVLPGTREVALRSLRRRRGDPVVPPDPDEREQVARSTLRARRARHGSRDRPAHPHPDREARPSDPSRARAVCPRARRRSGSSRGSRRSSAAATPRSASSGSSTRTATSSRWHARSRTRPRDDTWQPEPASERVRVRVHDELPRVDPRELGTADASQDERTALDPKPHVEEPTLVPSPRQLDAERLPAHRVERVDERQPAGLLVERVHPDGAGAERLRHRHPRHCAATEPRVDDRLAHETARVGGRRRGRGRSGCRCSRARRDRACGRPARARRTTSCRGA